MPGDASELAALLDCTAAAALKWLALCGGDSEAAVALYFARNGALPRSAPRRGESLATRTPPLAASSSASAAATAPAAEPTSAAVVAPKPVASAFDADELLVAMDRVEDEEAELSIDGVTLLGDQLRLLRDFQLAVERCAVQRHARSRPTRARVAIVALPSLAAEGEAAISTLDERVEPTMVRLHTGVKLGLRLDATGCFDAEGGLLPAAERAARVAMHAAIGALTLATTPGVSKLAISDELMGDMISLCKLLCTELVFPAIDPGQSRGATPSAKKRAKKHVAAAKLAAAAKTPAKASGKRSGRRGAVAGKSEGGGVGTPARAKATRGATPRSSEKSVSALVALLADACDLFEELLARDTQQDADIVALCGFALGTLYVEGSSAAAQRHTAQLQHHALRVLRAIFSRYPGHRISIVKDVAASLLRLPTSKRALRTFRLHESSDAVQMVSALLLQLTQSVLAHDGGSERAWRDAAAEEAGESAAESDAGSGAEGGGARRRGERGATPSIRSSMEPVAFFYSFVIKHASEKEHGKEYRAVLKVRR
jgi:hypothetical protein